MHKPSSSSEPPLASGAHRGTKGLTTTNRSIPMATAPPQSPLSTQTNFVNSTSGFQSMYPPPSSFNNLPPPVISNGIYPKVDSTSVNQQLYNIQNQHHKPSSSVNSNNSNGGKPNRSKSKRKQDASSAQRIYDSSSQIISGISSYVKSIPWTNLAKQLNEYGTYVSSAIGSVGNGATNSTIGDVGTISGNEAPFNYYLGYLIWSDFVFVPVAVDSKDVKADDPRLKEERLFMVLAYTNGFQIFDVHDPNNVREIISKRSDDMVCDMHSIVNSQPAVPVQQENDHLESIPTHEEPVSQHIIRSRHEVDDISDLSDENQNSDHVEYVNNENLRKSVNTESNKHLPFEELFKRMENTLDSDDEMEQHQDFKEHFKTEPAQQSTNGDETFQEPKIQETQGNIDIQHYLKLPPIHGSVKMTILLAKPSKKAISQSEKRQKTGEKKNLLRFYPLVSIVTETEPNTIHLYSLKYQTYLDDYVKISCGSNIHDSESVTVFQTISSEESFVVTDSSGQVYFFDPCTFEQISQGTCFPSRVQKKPLEGSNTKRKKKQQPNEDELYGGIMAIRKRFVAFASNSEVLNPKLDFTTKINSTLTEKSWDVAKKAATGIYMLGDLGLKKVSKYWAEMNEEKKKKKNYYSDESSQSDVSEDEDGEVENFSFSSLWNADLPAELASFEKTVGTIEIRDLRTNKVLLHFRAHNEPIAAMAFDRTGTLLCTAPLSGKYLNVFQILPNFYSNGDSTSSEKNIKLLYRLYRGFTSAHIQDIHFSVNSKWVAACSARGTIHLYAINPTGGPIDPRFHYNGEQQFSNSAVPECLVLNVVARIHDQSGGKKGQLGPNFAHNRSVFQFYSLSEFKSLNLLDINEDTVSTSDDDWEQQNININNENVLVTLNSGMLSYYLLKPQLKKKEKASAPENLNKTTVGTASSGLTSVHPIATTSADDFDLSLAVELIARFDIFQPQVYPHDVGQPVDNEQVFEERRHTSITWNNLFGFEEEAEKVSPRRFIDEKQDTLSKWISNVELETYSQPTNPLWATGHFKFRTIKAESSSSKVYQDQNVGSFNISDDDYNQMNDLSKSLYIKVSNPIPINKNKIESGVNEDEPKPLEAIDIGTITKAIDTPMTVVQPSAPLETVSKPITHTKTTEITVKQPSPKIIPKQESPPKPKHEEKHVSILAHDTISTDSSGSDDESTRYGSPLQPYKSNTKAPNTVTYLGSSVFGEMTHVSHAPNVGASILGSRDPMRESKLLSFSHMENYFEDERSDKKAKPLENTAKQPESKSSPNLGFSLTTSIQKDYFDDEENNSSEMEQRKQILKQYNQLNKSTHEEEFDEDVDEYFNDE